VFSGVDKIIRGKLEELELEDAKFFFWFKFWGAVVVGKGMLLIFFSYFIDFLKGCKVVYMRTGLNKRFFLAVMRHNLIRPGGSLTLNSGNRNSAGGALNGAVLSLTKGLASDLAEKKTSVNCVVPGLMQTQLWDKLDKTAEEKKELYESAAEKLPVGLVGMPEDVAKVYLYCVRADYAMGSLVVINGGSVL